MTVVGVVSDTKQESLADAMEIEMFAPGTQEMNWFPPSHVVVRTAGDPLAITAAARAHVRALDPSMAIDDVRPLEAVIVWSSFGPLALAGPCWKFGRSSRIELMHGRRQMNG